MIKLWLSLLDGKTTFNDEDDDYIDDFGADGPTFGPYEMIQLTSGFHLKMYRADGEQDTFALEANGDMEDDPHYRGGTVKWGELYYNDFTIHEMPDDTPPNYPAPA